MKSQGVSAVLFVKDLTKVAAFYSQALGMRTTFADQDHAMLDCSGFGLIVHQIPNHLADDITIKAPPERRVWGAIRLDYPVRDIDESRKAAGSLGGGIDVVPPPWADPNANFFFGYDPEGNQFGVRQQEAASEVANA